MLVVLDDVDCEWRVGLLIFGAVPGLKWFCPVGKADERRGLAAIELVRLTWQCLPLESPEPPIVERFHHRS